MIDSPLRHQDDGARQTIPATVIGGYLGAGKSTLVNRLLRNAGGVRLAVLVNELGDIAIDADLIEAQDDNLISIAGGCICCSYGSDLVAALMDMACRDPRPDQVLIETSGVALPGPVAAALSLIADFRRDATVVLADVTSVRRNAGDRYLSDTILRQLAEADLVLATKVDRVAPEERDGVCAWLREQAPQARVLAVEHGDIPLPLLASAGLEQTDRLTGKFTGLDLSPHRATRYATMILDLSGGIDPGEDPQTAAIRELGEETGVAPHLVRIIGRSAKEHVYDLPPELMGKMWKGKYRGQSQIWFAMKFLGTDADINIATEHQEFRSWRWAAPDTLVDLIVPFKKQLYADVLAEFSVLLQSK